MHFQNDYRHMLDVLGNRRPQRLPIYEHIIDPVIMEAILDVEFAGLFSGSEAELLEFFTQYCRFWQEMTYDTVSFEVTITDLLPDHGAIYGGRPGPIQTRADFDRYPWDVLPDIYWAHAGPRFDALRQCMPHGMMALGGVGNGVLEISEDLVGFQQLAYMQVDDPDLYADLYRAIGDLMVELWTTFLERHADAYAICRFGDDLGFKTSTLVSPTTIRRHIIPQYASVIGLIRGAGKPFLWHSCGKIFSIMDDVIALGIGAKHSNEDADRAVRRMDRALRRPHRPARRHRRGHPVPERAGRDRGRCGREGRSLPQRGQRLRPGLGQLNSGLRARRGVPGHDRGRAEDSRVGELSMARALRAPDAAAHAGGAPYALRTACMA